MNVWTGVLWAVCFSALLGIALAGYILARVQRLPAQRPGTLGSFRDRINNATQVVVCAGDSLTHGSVSVPWVEQLQEQPDLSSFVFVNAGINSELAWNLLQRLEPIVECRPQHLILLIGTNDVLASAGETNRRRYMLTNRLPQTPSVEWYQQNLTAIVQTLKRRTQARIALLSLPLVTEDLSDPVHAILEQHIAAIKTVAHQESVSYLPLFEHQLEALTRAGHTSRLPFQQGLARPIYGFFHLFLLGGTLDGLAQKNGYMFLTDGIHLGSRGGEQIKTLVRSFLLPPTS